MRLRDNAFLTELPSLDVKRQFNPFWRLENLPMSECVTKAGLGSPQVCVDTRVLHS